VQAVPKREAQGHVYAANVNKAERGGEEEEEEDEVMVYGVWPRPRQSHAKYTSRCREGLGGEKIISADSEKSSGCPARIFSSGLMLARTAAAAGAATAGATASESEAGAAAAEATASDGAAAAAAMAVGAATPALGG